MTMKFNGYFWNLYKSSPEGKTAITRFSQDERSLDTDTQLIEEYCKEWVKTDKRKSAMADTLEDVWAYKVSEYGNVITSPEAAKAIYEEIIDSGLSIEGQAIIRPKDYIRMLGLVPFLSMGLSFIHGEYFVPYLFMYRFRDLRKIADIYGMNLPKIPKKSDYRSRCMYYWELCEMFNRFRKYNGMSADEMSAFLYDFAPKVISKEEPAEMPEPAQAWFIGGLANGYGDEWRSWFWQANEQTRRGDILIHYETSPVSAITGIWTAQTDGVTDPFFHYYCNTYIGNRVSIPNITLDELKSDAYFKSHPLVKKNLQGVNGWTATAEDYAEIKRMVSERGCDADTLPKLYAPNIPTDINIIHERDVEKNLLEPLLNAMGFYEGKDFIRQLPLRAGRGHRIFPDYALHYIDRPDEESANVLIEAKLLMKSNQDIEDAFRQAKSYANLLDSSVIILCDRNVLIVYERKHGFDRERYTRYFWNDMRNPDKYNRLLNQIR